MTLKGGIQLWLVSPEDLILSKLDWSKDTASEMQRRDIKTLLSHVSGLDHGYLRKWAAFLGISDLMEEALR